MQSGHNLSSILIVEDSQGRREIVLDAAVYSMGRDSKCDIRLASQFMSRHHATLIQLPTDNESHYYRIVDGNLKGKPSTNGILINGRKLRTHDLENGDEIVFGPQARAVYYQLMRGDPSDSSGSPSGPTPSCDPAAPEFGTEVTPDNGTSYIP